MNTLNFNLDLVICALALSILFFIALIVRLNNFIMSAVILFLTFLFITILLYYFGFSFIGSLFLIIYGGGILVLYFIVIQFNNVTHYSKLFNNKLELSVNFYFLINFILISFVQFTFLKYFKLINFINITNTNSYFSCGYGVKNNNLNVMNKPYALNWSNNNLNVLIHLVTTTHSFILLCIALILLITLYLSITLLKLPHQLK